MIVVLMMLQYGASADDDHQIDDSDDTNNDNDAYHSFPYIIYLSLCMLSTLIELLFIHCLG